MEKLWQLVRDLRLWFANSSLEREVTGARPANARSMELMVRNLSPQQRDQYERFGHFDVIGCVSGRTYRINYGTQLNIEELGRHGQRVRLLCFSPGGLLPVADVMLAQKLALELFELDALRIARKTVSAEGRLLF